MANVSATLRRIRRARRRADAAQRSFEQVRDEYERILEAAEEKCGEEGVDEVADWIVEETRENRRLPHPDRVRDRAREACAARDVEISAESPLRE